MQLDWHLVKCEGPKKREVLTHRLVEGSKKKTTEVPALCPVGAASENFKKGKIKFSHDNHVLWALKNQDLTEIISTTLDEVAFFLADA